MMTFNIILDFIVIGFLIATIAYAISLNKKLSSLYQSRGELQTFLENFTRSLSKAEASMDGLRVAGERTFSQLQDKLTQGGTLASDLSFLVERGEAATQKLEALVTQAKAMQTEAVAASSAAKKAKKGKSAPEEPSVDEEPELVRNLRNVR
ncbi:MAG: hypothetical protein C0514_06015 [Candidatus Puniceispirillum sp.]|nr:hypothetical protein [Candidatus Puniceispirillum sp.]